MRTWMSLLATVVGSATLSWAQQAAARRERRRGSPIICRVARDEKVTVVTGVVVTLEAGRVQFRVPHEMGSLSGRLYDELDGTEFFDAACEDDPGRCAGFVEKPQREWWAQLHNAGGRTGWTDEPHTFTQPRVG